MQDSRVLGITGWSGAGKTMLLTRLIPVLVQRGLRIATLKHAHHDFDVDIPGKDSYEHRKAGASEVIICSSRRWVHMHELGTSSEPKLRDLLRKFTPYELVLVEGFKYERHPKLEVFRSTIGKPALFCNDRHVVAVAADTALSGQHPPLVNLNDTAAVADCVLAFARPLEEVLAALDAED